MNDVEDVLAVERQWTEAHLYGDVRTIKRLMAEEYIRIQPDGSLANKSEIVASLQPGRRSWDAAQGDEYDIRVYGDAAVVVGRWTARGVNNGQPFDYAARFLSVYVKHEGQWLMAAEQSTEIR